MIGRNHVTVGKWSSLSIYDIQAQCGSPKILEPPTIKTPCEMNKNIIIGMDSSQLIDGQEQGSQKNPDPNITKLNRFDPSIRSWISWMWSLAKMFHWKSCSNVVGVWGSMNTTYSRWWFQIFWRTYFADGLVQPPTTLGPQKPFKKKMKVFIPKDSHGRIRIVSPSYESQLPTLPFLVLLQAPTFFFTTRWAAVSAAPKRAFSGGFDGSEKLRISK